MDYSRQQNHRKESRAFTMENAESSEVEKTIFVIPAPHQVRDKLQLESSGFMNLF